jgi:hypothetical protein
MALAVGETRASQFDSKPWLDGAFRLATVGQSETNKTDK